MLGGNSGHVRGSVPRIKNDVQTTKIGLLLVQGITVTTDGMASILSIDPLHAVILPRSSPRHISTILREQRLLSFHPKFNGSVNPDFVIITTGDVPSFGHVGPGQRRENEDVWNSSIMGGDGRTWSTRSSHHLSSGVCVLGAAPRITTRTWI